MRRTMAVMFFLFLILTSPVQAASSELELFPALSSLQAASPCWRLTGIGKPSTNPLLLPNNSLLITSGKKLISVSLAGQILWQANAPTSGSLGQPVCAADGSVFIPSGSSLLRLRPNGAGSVLFTVYPTGKSRQQPVLAASESLIFLPLPDALYVLDFTGNSPWVLTPWDNSEKYNTRTVNDRGFCAAVVSAHTFYTVYGDKKNGWRLAAVADNGKMLWTYWLGNIESAALAAGKNDTCYLTVSSKKETSTKTPSATSKSKNLKYGYTYCFSRDKGPAPQWKYSFTCSGSLPAPVVGEDTVYVSSPGHIWAFASAKGTLTGDNLISGLCSPVAVDHQGGFLYAGTEEGLVSISPDYRLKWSLKLDGAVRRPPLIGNDGYIYVVTDKGSLYKIKDNRKNQSFQP